MPINGSTIITDTTIFLRDMLASGITDPITRATNERFIMTSYPERPATYPLITVVPQGPADIRRLGFQSEEHYVKLPYEIRIWARSQRQKEQLTEQVYTWLRTNQFSGTYATTDQSLWGFRLDGTTIVDEPGKDGVKSFILNIQYNFIAI